MALDMLPPPTFYSLYQAPSLSLSLSLSFLAFAQSPDAVSSVATKILRGSIRVLIQILHRFNRNLDFKFFYLEEQVVFFFLHLQL